MDHVYSPEATDPVAALTEAFPGRADVFAWLARFLWQLGCADNEMGEGEAANIIISNLTGRLPVSDSGQLPPLVIPRVLFQEWKTQQDRS